MKTFKIVALVAVLIASLYTNYKLFSALSYVNQNRSLICYFM